ncbi:MAG: GNAT family N-acetyltransferase [Bacillota bacterium]
MITSRGYRPGDEDGIVALLNLVFGENRSVEWWKWYYLQNPAGAAVARVAVADDQIVGFRAMVPYYVGSGMERVLACQATDAATHPGYRKRGIFRILTSEAIEEAKARGWSFVFSFPNTRSYPLNARYGWRPVGRPRTHFRWLSGAGSIARSGLDQFSSLGTGFEAHCQRPGPAGMARVCKDASYLDWRYLKHPDRTYRVLGAGLGGDVEAYAVVRMDRARLPRAYLLEFSPGQLPPAHFLSRIVSYLAAHRVRLLAAWDGTIPGGNMLGLGFLPHPWRSGILAVRGLNALPPSAMGVTMGDTDYA